MVPALADSPSPRIRRADVFAYLFALMGLQFVGENTMTMLEKGTTLGAVSGATLGLFGLLAAGLIHRNPDELRQGNEPAPAYLYVLVVVATLAFLVLVGFWVGVLS
jgi:hypothetical protein